MDIFNLGKSKLRRNILKLYFSHPEKRYYLRELERLLEKPVAYVRREMLALEKASLFNSEFQGKEKYFSLNRKFSLYKELEKIVSKTIGLEKNLADGLVVLKDIEAAFIFGSFAKGDHDGLSDIDLMIIGRPDEDKLIAVINRLETEIGREINYHIFSRNDLTKKMKEKNSFIKSVISHPKLFLIGHEKNLSKFS